MSRVSLVIHDLRRLFKSPLPWLIFALVVLALSWVQLTFLEHFMTNVRSANQVASHPVGYTDAVAAPVLLWATLIGLIVTPILSSILVTRERNRGVWAWVYGAGVHDGQQILGKIVVTLIFLTVLLVITAGLIASFGSGTTIDRGQMIAAFAGALMALLSFACATTFFALITRNPGVAILLAYALLGGLWLLQLAASGQNAGNHIFRQLAHWSHLPRFFSGVIDTRDVSYYLLFSLVFFFLSVSWIRFARSRRDRRQLAMLILCAFVSIMAAIAAGKLLSERWQRLDLNDTANPLTPAVVDLMNQFHSSVIANAVTADTPAARETVESLLAPLKAAGLEVDLSFGDLTLQRIRAGQGALRPHLKLRYGDSEQTVYAFTEGALINALQRLLHGREYRVVFAINPRQPVTATDTADNGYSSWHQSLEAQGFTVSSLTITAQTRVPDNIDVLIITGNPANPLDAAAALQQYLDHGGSLIWLNDGPPFDPAADRLATRLPLAVSEETLKRAKAPVYKGLSDPGIFEFQLNTDLLNLDDHTRVTLPLAAPLEFLAIPPWRFTPLIFTSDTKQAGVGDVAAGLLTRPFGAGEQRVLVSGDSDFLRNAFIADNRLLSIALVELASGKPAQQRHSQQLLVDSDYALDDARLRWLSLVWLVVVPLAFALIGIWRHRVSRRA